MVSSLCIQSLPLVVCTHACKIWTSIRKVHNWAFMAKKGFVSIIPKFAQMQMEVGFTIEAHSDAEMPECMLGSTVLSYINDTTGHIINPNLQEPVHEHQA